MIGRISTRFSLVHACMLGAALVTFVSTTSVLRERAETQPVVIARTELAAGSPIDPQSMTTLFDIVLVRADSPFVDGAVDPEAAPVGQLDRPLAEGEPLRMSDVVELGTGSIERTITIAVDEITLTGLGLRVGDDVDVIGSVDDGRLAYVVVGVRIARLPAAPTGGGAFAVREGAFITVEVSDEEALRIAAALHAGDVEVVRSTGARSIAAEEVEG